MAASPAATPTAPTAHTVTLEAPTQEERPSPLAVGSWALYDFANTIFSLNIISVYFPQFIVRDLQLNDAVYAYPMSAAMLVVALIMPALGALSDRAGKRMPWLIATTLLCVGMTALMGISNDLTVIVIALVIANIGYQTALIFYDALLPSVSTTLNWGKVSGLGVGLGYAGALLGGFLVQQFIGRDAPSQHAFLPTAALFLIFALPCFFFVRERKRVPSGEDPSLGTRYSLLGTFTQTFRTLREAAKVRGLLTFLVANFFYSDALNTVIIAMGVYAIQVIGFGSAFDVLAPAIIAAVIGSLLFGLVTDRLTSKQALVISLLMWAGVFLAAMFITDRFLFQYVIAPVAGVALGSTWTAARTMMIELSPRERLGEFLGLYNLTGKFSAVLGPILWGTTLLVLDPRIYGHFAYQVAIGTLLLMVLIGLAIHLRTPNIRRLRGTLTPPTQ